MMGADAGFAIGLRTPRYSTPHRAPNLPSQDFGANDERPAHQSVPHDYLILRKLHNGVVERRLSLRLSLRQRQRGSGHYRTAATGLLRDYSRACCANLGLRHIAVTPRLVEFGLTDRSACCPIDDTGKLLVQLSQIGLGLIQTSGSCRQLDVAERLQLG